jgi:hypothetical protein
MRILEEEGTCRRERGVALTKWGENDYNQLFDNKLSCFLNALTLALRNS